MILYLDNCWYYLKSILCLYMPAFPPPPLPKNQTILLSSSQFPRILCSCWTKKLTWRLQSVPLPVIYSLITPISGVYKVVFFPGVKFHPELNSELFHLTYITGYNWSYKPLYKWVTGLITVISYNPYK